MKQAAVSEQLFEYLVLWKNMTAGLSMKQAAVSEQLFEKLVLWECSEKIDTSLLFSVKILIGTYYKQEVLWLSV